MELVFPLGKKKERKRGKNLGIKSGIQWKNMYDAKTMEITGSKKKIAKTLHFCGYPVCWCEQVLQSPPQVWSMSVYASPKHMRRRNVYDKVTMILEHAVLTQRRCFNTSFKKMLST